MTNTQQQYPTLYHTGKSGAVVQWNIWTEGADIVTEWGQIGGKMQTARKTAIGKNIGKINETSPEGQAVLEANAMHKKKTDLKYSLSIEEAKKEVFLPMLATSFEKRLDKVTYPVDVQPKLDGVRCMAFWEGDSVKLMSRGGKYWECSDHISEQLEGVLPKGWVLDGELYLHGATFQEITKLVKKLRSESVSIEYHVYDVPRTDEYNEGEWDLHRMEALADFRNSIEGLENITVTDTYQANSENEVYELQSLFLEQGYEGAIVREADGVYRFGYRSNKLLKVKNFMDEEYKIVNFTTGVGKFDGCIVWICETESGEQFKVVPQGTMEERQEAYETASNHIGEMLKVKFFELTDDGIPRFPVGLGIRLVEDM